MNMPLIITKFGNYLRHAFVSRLAFAFWRIFRGNHMQLVFFYQHKRMYNQLCKGGNVNCTASAIGIESRLAESSDDY